MLGLEHIYKECWGIVCSRKWQLAWASLQTGHYLCSLNKQWLIEVRASWIANMRRRILSIPFIRSSVNSVDNTQMKIMIQYFKDKFPHGTIWFFFFNRFASIQISSWIPIRICILYRSIFLYQTLFFPGLQY